MFITNDNKNMGCNCTPKNYSVSMGCCQPVLGPVENYYTKPQIDRMLEEIVESGCCITPEEVESAITSAMTIVEGEIPSLSGYATEEWVINQNYITGVDLSDYATKEEIPSLSGYATEQWVLDKHYITGVDLSDYALKSEIPTVPTSNTAFTNDAGYITGVDLSDYVTYESLPDLSVYATKTWVTNQNYVTNSVFIQYITSLQQQIDSLKEQISGCCGSTGETLTRWITMTGENDYTCSGTTKYTKEKEQASSDGGNTWTDTGNYRAGSTVLEVNSADCGYVTPLKFRGILRNNYHTPIEVPCNSSDTLSRDEVYTTSGYKSIEIGDCVRSIGERAFSNQIHMTSLTIPSGVTTIESMAFADVGNSTGVTSFTLTLSEGLITIGDGAFFGSRNYSTLVIPNSVQSIGDGAFYTNNISTLTIGSGVTTIGSTAFQKSTGETQYESITVLALTPPTISSPTTNLFGNVGVIYVPSASVNAYKAASGWTQYASRIQAIS